MVLRMECLLFLIISKILLRSLLYLLSGVMLSANTERSGVRKPPCSQRYASVWLWRACVCGLLARVRKCVRMCVSVCGCGCVCTCVRVGAVRAGRAVCAVCARIHACILKRGRGFMWILSRDTSANAQAYRDIVTVGQNLLDPVFRTSHLLGKEAQTQK